MPDIAWLVLITISGLTALSVGITVSLLAFQKRA